LLFTKNLIIFRFNKSATPLLPNNLLRSISYIQDNAGKLLADAMGERRVELPDEESFWKFYAELIPFLQQYAAEQKNEEILRLTGLYVSQLTEIKNCPKYQGSFFFDLFSSSKNQRHYQRTEEYIRAIQDIYNNAGNLLYQVKINI